ncbi:inactive hydroxysteroid dehydrogenase-like protein 1 isoform X2 [Cimex lectularius]|uniref:Uncharacterized protein n=1 Tax=Cimex lectularius TaxID=79782 RepID=A0A8I6RLH1_CIMLE|nr:inactive hydroxysteroid dehydrogenase-like protein 1 isoform X2 [Cimex lectularius]
MFCDEYIGKFLTILGGLYLLKCTVSFLFKFWFGFRAYLWSRIAPRADLKSKYGPWTVVTGSTDGLGKEFALQLAKQGMNIVLISRSETKLQSTAAEIKALYDVEVQYIQADFSSTDAYDKIRKVLDGLDIGILVNNVGILNERPESIADQSEEFVKTIVNVNIIATTINTLIVLNQMKKKNRGMIINMGSQSGVFPVPYIGIYSSTKAFVDHFSAVLDSELEHTNIKIKCFRGGFIKTNLLAHIDEMVNFYRRYFPPAVPDAKTYVESAIATLNTNATFTSGYWGHGLVLFVVENFMNNYVKAKFSKFIMTSKLIWRTKKK